MLIEDMKPLNRLEAAKGTIKRFIEGRSSDRIGLVIFAGESFTVVPPTLDYQLILQRVDEITTAHQAHIKDGTALGVAMANAAGRLKDSQAKSRVIIFMTDGENNSGTIDPETGLDIAKGYGIKIYSIGIGKDGPTRIPIYMRDAFGQKVKTYQPFDSTVNDDLLGRMAKDTGGKYYRASKEDSLVAVFKDIDSLEKTKIDINKFTNYTEKFPPYLIAAILIYLAALILGRSWLRRAP
jgi:Ca-activated chloride channel family protein